MWRKIILDRKVSYKRNKEPGNNNSSDKYKHKVLFLGFFGLFS